VYTESHLADRVAVRWSPVWNPIRRASNESEWAEVRQPGSSLSV